MKDLIEKVRDQIEEEFKPEPWPEMGTKEWFQRYVSQMNEYSKRQITEEKSNEIFKNLNKFDPVFATLTKKAHDSAIEIMNYAKERMENK